MVFYIVSELALLRATQLTEELKKRKHELVIAMITNTTIMGTMIKVAIM